MPRRNLIQINFALPADMKERIIARAVAKFGEVTPLSRYLRLLIQADIDKGEKWKTPGQTDMTNTPLKLFDVGFHDITPEEYHADPCVRRASLSRSAAWTMISECPLMCYTEHPKFGGQGNGDEDDSDEPTKAMDYGSVGHVLLLGKGMKVAVGDFNNYMTKAAKEWRDAVRADRDIPVLRKVYDRAVLMVAGIRRELQRFGLLAGLRPWP